jgi:hypothetical protein
MDADRHIEFRKKGSISGMDRSILLKFETHVKKITPVLSSPQKSRYWKSKMAADHHI